MITISELLAISKEYEGDVNAEIERLAREFIDYRVQPALINAAKDNRRCTDIKMCEITDYRVKDKIVETLRGDSFYADRTHSGSLYISW